MTEQSRNNDIQPLPSSDTPDGLQSARSPRFDVGDIVSGLDPAELVEISRLAAFGSKTLVEGIGTQSRRVVRRPLSDEELAGLVRVRGRAHSFTGDAEKFLLGGEAQRIRIAHQFDPLFAVNSS